MRRLLAAGVLPLLLAAGLATSTATTVQAASRSCTSWSWFEEFLVVFPEDPPGSAHGFAQVPTVGAGTHDANCVLGVGNQGPAVAVLQTALAVCNGHPPQGGADGIYGTHTRDAVKATQRDLGISADGVYGPQTRSVMGWPVALDNGGRSCLIGDPV